MRISSGLGLAWRSMSRYRLRAFFMMAGVMVGICSLTILDSVGQSTKRETMQRFKNMLGTFDTVMIRPGAGRTRGMVSLTNVPPTLKFEDAQAIATNVPEVKRVALLQNAFDIDVSYRDRTDSPAIFGVSANWFDLLGNEVVQGSLITDEDVRSLARVAVLGSDVRPILFPGEDAIGKTIRIGEVPFQVKGVLASRGAGPGGGSLDHLILIPVSTASKRLFNRDFLTMVIAQLRDPVQSDAAVRKITALLRQRHHIAASALDDFTITNPRATMAQVTRMGSTLSKTLEGTAIFATLIGGVVIMSLMLIAVSERRKEIGVRRSVGASRRDILSQFIAEALLISSLGGLLGIVLGLAGTNLLAKIQKLPPIFEWNALAWAAGISVGLGFIFGIYPAWKAAQVDPVTALRS
ncbi:MAG TPA: ABC transporter permease [Candidatus Acidoferrales bacterium]|nr:ABC transporter permease [Candidatus Acidoferrales bacterium]